MPVINVPKKTTIDPVPKNALSDGVFSAVKGSSIEWTKESAETWNLMKAPSRPSVSELEIYQEYFKRVKREMPSTEKPKALILGSTIEFRKLAFNEGFDVFVVDYSAEYYEEISKSLNPNIVKAERFVCIDWCKMGDYLKNELNRFKIIIGDLAIGNVAPENLEMFFKSISCLLSRDGFFLGKSIYKYSNYSISSNDITEKLRAVACDQTITSDNLYEHLMFPLSIYAGSFDEELGCQRIDFVALFKTVTEFVERNKSIIVPEDKFAIYLRDETRFDTRMPKNFYIYSYQRIMDVLYKETLYIDDVRYGKNDSYKSDFPLLVIKKGVPSTTATTPESFIDQAPNIIKKNWKNSITALYFIKSVLPEDTEDEASIWNTYNFVKKVISESRIEINERFNYFLSEIPSANMQQETDILTASTPLEDERIKKILQFNYTCGLLISLLHKETDNKQNYLLDFVVRTLFSHYKDGKWEPEGAPWMSARICICLYPLYEEWKTADGRYQNYINKVERVVKQLAYRRGNDNFWTSETGNHFDTSALCLEMLNLYNKYIPSLSNILNEMRELHIDNSRIQETFIKYPQDVINEMTINGKPAYKKLCGRISWYSILYLLAKEEDKPIIAMHLKSFCYLFTQNYEKLINTTHNKEIGLIPQIIYSLKRTGIF